MISNHKHRSVCNSIVIHFDM